MKLGKWILGGLVGGLAGVALWALIAYLGHLKSGWPAVPVGALVGLGVHVMAGKPKEKPPENPFRRRPRKSARRLEEEEEQEEQKTRLTEVTAAVLAVALAVAGKGAALYLAVAGLKLESGGEQYAPKDVMIATLASEVARDQIGKGRRLSWPPGRSLENAAKQSDFPPDVWQEAAKRWEALGTAEQESRLAGYQKQMDSVTHVVKTQRRHTELVSGYGVLDVLWIALAGAAAFGVNWRPKPKPKEEE
jgi:hypothetical protein